MTTAMRSARARIIGSILALAALALSSTCTNLGASGITILALGGLVMPLLLGFGYRQRPAPGLETAAGPPGVLRMPVLPLILYAIVWEPSLPGAADRANVTKYTSTPG